MIISNPMGRLMIAWAAGFCALGSSEGGPSPINYGHSEN